MGTKEKEEVEAGKGDLSGKKLRIIDDAHAFCGRCFVCEGSTKDFVKGYVAKEEMGYWKDDTRIGNVFVKISSVKVVEEDEKEILRWKKMHLTNAQKTDVAVRFGWPSAMITAEDVYLDDKSNMLSTVHLEMLEWLSRRDLDVPSKNIGQKMAFFAPSFAANAFARISKMTDKDSVIHIRYYSTPFSFTHQ